MFNNYFPQPKMLVIPIQNILPFCNLNNYWQNQNYNNTSINFYLFFFKMNNFNFKIISKKI